ncbi:terminase gpA endonuclease subunit [Thalassoglobus sp.]|uniref:terminase gpA endonuclease subunit n=1 Tax=Thalassoglobus sp. TaxID=2795869 RepID=UPI003AA9CCA0
MRRKRASERDLSIPTPVNPERRKAALANHYVFMETYFPDTFYQGWTENRRAMVDAIFRSLKYKTAEGLAAPRGEGKSTIAKVILLYCILKRLVRFGLIICSTSEYGDQRLSDLKKLMARPKSKAFREDFPELFVPCSDVDKSAHRAKGQTIGGELTNVEWTKNQIVLPTVTLRWCPNCLTENVAESQGTGNKLTCQDCGNGFEPWEAGFSGAIVSAKGITGSIREQNVDDERPDLVLIDDPDDEESADSLTKTRKAVKKINQSIRGLAGPGESLARVMLCTIINRQCAAFLFTDRKLNPTWNGKRFRLINKWPTNMELWDEYVEKFRTDLEEGDEFGRRAHQFYLDNREAMDAGAELSNPYRYDDTKTPDGSPREVSALQQCFNVIADIGRGSFDTEFQNDPPKAESKSTESLTVGIVSGSREKYAGRLTGENPRIVPETTEYLTAFVDVQGGWLWVEVTAWSAGRCDVIDYFSFGRNILTSQYGQHTAIVERLGSLNEHWKANPYLFKSGTNFSLSCVLVDSGFEAPAVYDAVLEIGGVWRAAKGDSKYVHPKKATQGKVTSADGSPWCLSVIQHGEKLVHLVLYDPDWWKHRCQEQWLIEPIQGAKNAVYLFGSNPNEHREFSRQVASAKFVTEFDQKTGEKSYWLESRDNHLWDCHTGNHVGRSLCADSKVRAASAGNRRYGVISKRH